MMYKKLTISLFLSLLTAPVIAVPNISSVDGDVSHGQTIAIFGLGFGSKTSAAPLIFETVETGNFNGSWGDTHDLSVNTNNQRHSNSNFNAHLNFRGGGYSDGRFTAGNAVHPKWFVQYWFKIANNWDWGSTDYSGNNRWLSNIKMFRMWNPGGTDENFVVAITAWDNQAEYVMENVGAQNYGGHFMQGLKSTMSKDTWHLLQFEFADNSAVNQADGKFRLWFDGNLLVNKNNIVTRENDPSFKRPFIIGFSEVWGAGGESDDAPNDFYMDDVYMDNTWARVELGNSPIYNNCTHREVQTPVSWTGNSINIRVNAGSFPTNAPVYLFVVDSNGDVNGTGFPLTLGVGSTGGGPGPDPVPGLLWNATQQTGDSNWKDSTVTYSVRLLIESDFISQSAEAIQLGFQGRSSGNYSIKKVSIAERDAGAPEGDVVDETWTRVVFNNNSIATWETDSVVIAAGAETKSKDINFSLNKDKDYYVTFTLESPGVYLNPPGSYRELFFEGQDHAGDIDWSSNGHGVTQDFHSIASIYSGTVQSGGGENNQPPVVNAGVDQTVFIDDGAVMQGGVSDDNGTPTYFWVQNAGPAVANIKSPLSLVTEILFGALGEYIFRLVANDGQYQVFDDVRITVNGQSSQIQSGEGGVARPHRGQDAEIQYAVTQSGLVEIKLFSRKGQEVMTLLSATQNAGTHIVRWNGRGPSGENLPSGVYIVTIKTAGGTSQQKVALIK